MRDTMKRVLPRIVILLTVFVAAVAMKSAGRSPFTKYDKTAYATPDTINFVRPGLVFKITKATIATDGTITANLKITDPQGLALDRLGVQTPGIINPTLMLATIPKGQLQYTSYTTTVRNNNGKTATVAAADAGGAWAQAADGSYTYTFNTKAPTGWDPTATHTLAVFGRRDLTAFDLGINHATDVFTFVPAGGAVTVTRDVVRDSSCNRCHDNLSSHGGNRIGVAACVLCHTPQTNDVATGNTVDFPVLIHKIHMGKALPSVVAGGSYTIGDSDWSTVGFPADAGGAASGVARCETCHDQKSGAAQATAYLTNPNQAACGSCHDDVNFATGENHVNLPQPNSNQCKICHTPQGELEFDASIKGAHTIPTESSEHPGMVIQILNVANGTAGSNPTVTFTVKDKAGIPIPMSTFTGLSRIAFVLGGPTQDPGYTNFGEGLITSGYVSESPSAATATCAQDGTCTYTFTHAIPKDAKGTFYVGGEGRRTMNLLAGTKKQRTNVEQGAKNVVFNFSVDSSPIQERRQVVSLEKCNNCHVALSLHGENRNQTQQCVICHNPSETDKPTKALATNPADKLTPLQSVNFALMIHKIHTGETQATLFNKPYVIVAFGGSHTEWSDVVFPAMDNSGQTGASNSCYMCHVDGSEQKFPAGLQNVTTPQGFLTSTPPVTSACTSCHASLSAASHALSNSNALGESCETCHGAAADFNVSKIHAK